MEVEEDESRHGSRRRWKSLPLGEALVQALFIRSPGNGLVGEGEPDAV